MREAKQQSMEYLMGSFQQILMGATCLFAAFFFGSYLHNRPAQQPVGQKAITPANPMESLFAFGKRDPAKLRRVVPTPTSDPLHVDATATAIDPSELAPVLVSNPTPLRETVAAIENSPLPRKPVVPDFSELASRFRNTPLDLASPASIGRGESPIHSSERVQFSGTFKAPEMVIRQPDLQPLRGFRDAVDRVEQAGVETVTANDSSTRWRVERPEPFDSFEPAPRTRPVVERPFAKPQFANREPRQTIEDVVSSHSADWLKEPQQAEFRNDDLESPPQQTFATNPPQSEGWNSLRRRQATEQAAQRHRGLLDIEDPGNRFRSGQDVAYEDPPEPDYRSYYRPSTERQDNYPQPANRLRGSQTRLQSIQSSRSPQNVSRQSNFDRSLGKRYEIQSGDTLQSISTRFYGTPEYYLSIYRANRDVLDRITSSPVGVVIEIPSTGN